MTDTTVTPPRSYQQIVIDWLKSPQGITAMQWALAPSGVLALKAMHWFGLSTDQWGWVANEVINFAPMAFIGGIQLVQRTHRAIISQVATILADRQKNGQPAGTIIINKGASDGAAKALADPALLNVVSAGSTEAVAAAKPS